MDSSTEMQGDGYEPEWVKAAYETGVGRATSPSPQCECEHTCDHAGSLYLRSNGSHVCGNCLILTHGGVLEGDEIGCMGCMTLKSIHSLEGATLLPTQNAEDDEDE
jgi:hypothetical protein